MKQRRIKNVFGLHCSIGMLRPDNKAFFPVGFDIEVRNEYTYG